MKQLPRSIRNNNPLNIDDNPNNKWIGLASRDEMTPEQMVEKRFAVFKSQVYGFRAAALLLQNYQDKHGLRTISDIINRWAPPSGKDQSTGQSYTQDTRAYAWRVAVVVGSALGELGMSMHTPIDVHDYHVMRALIEAMAVHETGKDPRTGKPWKFDPDVIDEGLRRAGISRPSTLDSAESMVAPAAVAAVAATDSAPLVMDVVDAVRGAEDHLTSGDFVRTAIGVVVVAGAAWVAYRAYRKSLVRNA